MNGGKLPLQAALSYETELVVMRSIDAGEPVGYGTTFHAPRQMPIGVIPLGYADGIPRALSNKGAVLIDGERAPIIGRIAMNMTASIFSRANRTCRIEGDADRPRRHTRDYC